MSRPPILCTVPARTPPASCRSCGARIYWVVTDAGRRMPVDCDAEGTTRPFVPVPGDGEPQDGRGVSHFATCPQAAAHRKPRGGAS